MVCFTAIAPAFPGMALSQSAPSASAPQAGGQIQDILVTALRTSEALQTTPVAVTALNEEALETAQVQMVDDLQRTTPSLSVGLGGSGPSTVIFLSIRGQGQVSPNSTADPAVRSEEHTSELQSLMRTSYAVFCLKKKKQLSHIN